MSKAGTRAFTARRTLARAALVSLVLLVNGCAGCNTCAAGVNVNWAYFKLHYRNNPKCRLPDDCKGIMTCPPEEMLFCEYFRGKPGGFCDCEADEYYKYPDAGAPIMRRLNNPDGGAPISGEWDGHRGILLSEDGRVIWYRDGGSR